MKKANLNLIDKAIAFINPKGAVDRLVARQKLKNFQYDAVKYTRERKGPSSLSGAEDYRSNYDRVELMKRARDLAENVGLVRSILMKFAGHVAGAISYQARTQNPQINSDVEAYWAEWWDKCDISTRHTGSTLMQVAIMSMLRDGDFLFVLVRDSDGNLKIQGIESDRLGDPFKVYTSLELIGGIHIDRTTGAPTAYDIYNRSIGDFYTYQLTIPSSQAFHLFDPLRIDQYRGISAFHTAINDATDIHELTSFEKMAAKTASSQSAIVKRNNNNAADLSTLTNDEDLAGNTIKLEAIESGKISYLEPGEDIVFPNGPSRPSGAFMEFHKVLMRNICLGLGIPYSFAVDPSAMSGPTARLEMQQAGRTFRRYQNLLNDKVLRPIKNIVLADAVARGLISGTEGTKTTKGIFNFGANVSIDLGRESASAISEFKTGLRTAADIYAERGQDFESAMRQRAIEAKLIKDLAEQYQIDPQTISDVVPPAKPEPQMPLPAITPEPPVSQEPPQDDEGEDEGGEEPEPDEPLEPSPENLEVKKKETDLEDCGTGAGGFKPGNTCAGGGDGDSESSYEKTTKDPDFIRDPSDERTFTLKGKSLTKDDIKNAIRKNGWKPGDTYKHEAGDIEILKPRPFVGMDNKVSAIEVDYSWRPKKGQGGGIRSIDFAPNEEIKFPKIKYQNKLINSITREVSHPAEKDIKDSIKKYGIRESRPLQEILTSLKSKELQMLIAGMMGGIELGKYDGIDFTPPQGARDAAKRALDVREGKPASQKGMTPVGIARARDLMNGVKLSPDTVRRMKAFFDRHEVDKKGATWDEQGKGWQAWNGWGGDAGYAWARKVVGQMEARDKKTEFVAGRDCGQDEGGTFGSDNKCAEGYGRPSLKGGYTPTRPGGKFPKNYKRPTTQKQKEQAKKPQSPRIPEKSKKEIPSSDKIKKGTAQSQEPDAKAVEWAKTIKSDKDDKKLFEDFTGSRFREINTNPEGQEGQRVISLINNQSSQTQKTDMYRGLSLKSEEDANRFFEGLRGGQTTNRTLTSFTPDPNQAAFFSFAKTKEPVSVFMTLKSSKNLKALQGVSVESFEQEFVLTRGKRLRLIGEPRRKKNTLEFEIDVEEY